MVLVLSFFLAYGASAQVWMGGSFGLSTSKEKGQKRLTDFRILPEFGTYFLDNVALGLKFGYSHWEEGIPDSKLRYNGWMIAPFVRYSFLNRDIGELFVDAQIMYERGKEKKFDTKFRTLEVGIYPGVKVNLNDRLALLGKFGFLGYTYEKVGGSKTNSWGLEADLDRLELGLIITM